MNFFNPVIETTPQVYKIKTVSNRVNEFYHLIVILKMFYF